MNSSTTALPGGGGAQQSSGRNKESGYAPRAPFHVILNARSGRDDPDATQETVERILRDAGKEYSITVVHKPADLARIAADCVHRAVRERGTVVSAGGDGATNAVAQLAWEKGCPLGVLPQGTFNYFGRTHGIPEEIAGSARLLVEGRVTPVSLGLINDKIFLVNASLGLYPDLLEERELLKRQYGRSRPVALVGGFFFLLREHRKMTIRVEIADSERTLRTQTLFIGNNDLQLARVGIPSPAEEERPTLYATMLKPVGKWEMLRIMMRGALGRLSEEENIINVPFQHMRVKHSRFVRGRIKVAIDGEILWLKTPLDFQVAPRPLLLIKSDTASVPLPQ